MNVDILQ